MYNGWWDKLIIKLPNKSIDTNCLLAKSCLGPAGLTGRTTSFWGRDIYPNHMGVFIQEKNYFGVLSTICCVGGDLVLLDSMCVELQKTSFRKNVNYEGLISKDLNLDIHSCYHICISATDHLIGMEFRMGILDVDDMNQVTLDMIIKAWCTVGYF